MSHMEAMRLKRLGENGRAEEGQSYGPKVHRRCFLHRIKSRMRLDISRPAKES